MNNIQFEKRKSIEQVEESNELAPKFDSNGLIPVVTTDFSSGELLMQGYMNEESFKKTLEISTKLRNKFSEANEISMGMSNDFELAIKNGSTMVRIGTGIFGERN